MINNKNGTIIICDDEVDIRNLFKEALVDEGYQTIAVASGEELFAAMKLYPVYLVFLDILLEHENGLSILERIKKDYPGVEVVIITGHGSIDLAVKATKLGAFDFISKPINLEFILKEVSKITYIQHLKDENTLLRSKTLVSDEFIGDSEPIRKIKDLIKVVGSSDSKVIIFGENGTGKELIARLIHLASPRAGNAFIAINCAAIPNTLIESELFGYEKGSFTNAIAQKKGKFELADNGTLFLDEIGDMPPETQAKLLRVIQDGKFMRIGGLDLIDVDVRIIAATNKNLDEEIREGRFREDLYYRLNVIPIRVPSLRERKEDIPLLVEYFLKKLADSNELRIREMTPEAMNLIVEQRWPGNIRQLRNIFERLNILSSDGVVTKDFVQTVLELKSTSTNLDPDSSELKDLREEYERKIIMERLKRCDWNIAKTAQSLNVERTNLYKKLKKYGIKTDD